MALTRPTLLSTAAFDATQQHIFVFNVVGGSQVVANKLVIRNNVTNQIVYTEKQESFKYEHIVNANELTNGVYYNAVISTFDSDGNESQVSSPIQFYCYSAPFIQFTNIPVGNLINNASFDFEFIYTQAEGELLNSYVVNLYNSFQSIISTSGNIYVTNGSPPYTGSYLFAGFEDNNVYYIEAIGQTINNTQVTTGLIQFTVDYIKPDLFSLVSLTNNCKEGYISIASNIVLITGESNPTPPLYIDNKEVDLTADGAWVEFNEGYLINGDFLSRAWFRKPTPYSSILQFSNADGQIINVRFMQGYEYATDAEMKAYVEVSVSSIFGVDYYIYSNYINIQAENNYYILWLSRVNNIYQVQLLNE